MSSNTTHTILVDRYGVASVDLEPYRGVVVDADGNVSYPASVGDPIDGVTVRGCEAGEDIRVVVDGVVPIQVSSATNVAKNVKLQTNTVGKFAEGASTNSVAAIAKEGASASDDVIQARVSDLIQEVVA